MGIADKPPALEIVPKEAQLREELIIVHEDEEIDEEYQADIEFENSMLLSAGRQQHGQ